MILDLLEVDFVWILTRNSREAYELEELPYLAKHFKNSDYGMVCVLCLMLPPVLEHDCAKKIGWLSFEWRVVIQVENKVGTQVQSEASL